MTVFAFLFEFTGEAASVEVTVEEPVALAGLSSMSSLEVLNVEWRSQGLIFYASLRALSMAITILELS